MSHFNSSACAQWARSHWHSKLIARLICLNAASEKGHINIKMQAKMKENNARLLVEGADRKKLQKGNSRHGWRWNTVPQRNSANPIISYALGLTTELFTYHRHYGHHYGH